MNIQIEQANSLTLLVLKAVLEFLETNSFMADAAMRQTESGALSIWSICLWRRQ